MKLFVTGGTGFIGTPLTRALVAAGHEPVVLTRPGECAEPPPGVRFVEGDPLFPGPWWEEAATCDGAVNLAGEPIQSGRWTPDKKRAIHDSRTRTTANLAAAIPAGKPFTLLSTSAVGIYGNAGEQPCDESAPPGSDFLAGVARDWEAEARKAEAKGARVAVTRFAVVLGPGGGALAELVKLANRGVLGPIGGGRTWFSWIHRDDLNAALLFLLARDDLQGVFNLSAPNPVRQGDFARALGRALGRPAFLPTPAFAVRLALGEAADFVLFSQRMVSRRLTEAGFSWKHPAVEEALADVLAPGAKG